MADECDGGAMAAEDQENVDLYNFAHRSLWAS